MREIVGLLKAQCKHSLNLGGLALNKSRRMMNDSKPLKLVEKIPCVHFTVLIKSHYRHGPRSLSRFYRDSSEAKTTITHVQTASISKNDGLFFAPLVK